MLRKKIEFPEDEKEEKYEEVWDFRKIAIGVVILLLLITGAVFAKKLYFHESLAPSSFIPKLPSVAGVATGPDTAKANHVKITLPSQQDVQNQIQKIRAQVSNLNVAEIASSSPQVQQVLQQIQNLPNAGTSQVKDACIRLCNNL